MQRLSFFPLEKKHENLILGWLRKEHVSEFFYGKGLENTLNDLEKYFKRLNSERDILFEYWIAYVDENPFGFLITSPIWGPYNPRDPYNKWYAEGETTITLDVLIGEEAFLGKGLAHRMIREFLKDKFSHASKVLIDPEKNNTKAIHVYEKAGFKKVEQFFPDYDPIPHWMMHLNMDVVKFGIDPDLSLVVDPSLTLKTVKLKDAASIFQLEDLNREHLRRFLGFLDQSQSVEDVKAFIMLQNEKRQKGEVLILLILYHNQFVGLIDLQGIDSVNRSASIGYWLDQRHQGKGIMIRCVKALVNFAFNALKLHRLQILCAVENKRSQKIPISLGFKKEGTLKDVMWHYGAYLDAHLYSLINEK